MKQKAVIKIVIDFLMTVLYVILMFDFGTGAFFHEVAGIFIGLLFVIHICLNYKAFIGMWRTFRSNKLAVKNVILLFLDILLIPAMFTVLFTGILISTQLFHFNLSSQWMTIYGIHNILSYVNLGILALHILLHAVYLYNVLKNILLRRREYAVKKAIISCTAAGICICIIYIGMYSLHNSDEFPAVSNSENNTSSEKSNSSQITSPDTPPTYSSSESSFFIDEDNDESKENDSSIIESSAASEDAASLSDYLGALHCTGCGRHCLLTNPRCSRGEQQAAQATEEYNNQLNIG